MIGIIDYKAGNLASVRNACQRLKMDCFVSSDTDELAGADGIIFPGVGHAESAMNALEEVGLDEFLRSTNLPVLGICLGMQLLFSSSEESSKACLGLIEGRLKKFDPTVSKVPHMGWNTVDLLTDHPLVAGLGEQPWFYFVHSYYAPVAGYSLGTCEYQTGFSAIVASENYMGAQFHPEKSGKSGEKLLMNFFELVSGKTLNRPVRKELS